MNIFKRAFLKIKSRIVKDPSLITKAEITLKLLRARKEGWVGHVEDEITFIQNKKFPDLNYGILKNSGILYIKDLKKVGKKRSIPWDYQYDTIEVFKRGGGDCNSINRVIQVFHHAQGKESYLVSYLAMDMINNHTTCIIKTPEGYTPCDYGYTFPPNKFETLKECVTFIASRYETKILCHVIQDINWKFVSLE